MSSRAPGCVLTVLATALVSVPASAPSASAAPAGSGSPARSASPASVALSRWDDGAAFRTGAVSGLRVKRGALVLAPGAQRTRGYRGTTYTVGTWTSAPVAPGFGASQLVASWAAATPRNSWVEVRVRAAGGRWLVLGRWAAADEHVARSSVAGQSDAAGRVDVDTWRAATATGTTSYQLQVRLMRRAGARSAPPSLSELTAVASRPSAGVPPVSAPGVARGIVLDVPRYSQMVHRGEFPQYGGGGEAWCSPTSTAMVLGYYRRLPSAASYAWTGGGTDPWVDEVARRTYDHAYRGTGNWPFNTAYAATRGLRSFVTRLRSLTEAESLVAAGIPVVVSVSFRAGALQGAPISSTAGHLLVVVGFTAAGDVVVNDPAAASAAGVRRTYARAELEAAWLGGSGGTAYVMHDDAHPLPPSPGTW